MKKIIVFLLAVCFAVSTVSAYNGVETRAEFWTVSAPTITGTIKTADGKAVKGVRLIVTGEALTEPVSVLSNGFGIFTIADLPQGAYTIKAEAKGYTFEQESQTFNASGEAVELNFTATPEAEKPQ